MASRLSGKVTRLEGCIHLLNHISDRLRYLQPSVLSLMEGVCRTEDSWNLAFPSRCLAMMKVGKPFPQSWREAVLEEAGDLGRAEADILAELSATLGSTDLESQLTAIAYTKELLEVKLAEARDYRNNHGRLYRTLGVLSGLAVAIVLF